MTKMAENKTYLCIDLKSFFASVECVERGLDPLCTNLVVADAALTEKNHLPCSISVTKKVRHRRTSKAF